LRKPSAYQAGELRVGTFTPKVTFRAAIDRFEHLITLGIADAPGKLVVLGVAIVLGGSYAPRSAVPRVRFAMKSFMPTARHSALSYKHGVSRDRQ
jgi:hypothetical protein